MLFTENGAIFSDCRKYRYCLFRNWNEDLKIITFIGLNPSTANENKDDPTIRRVMRFAFDWGYSGVQMLNLFALVTPYPKDLKQHPDPVGKNDQFLLDSVNTEVIFAWGSFSEATDRSKEVVKMFPNAMCLGYNKDGTPKHPLYVPGNTKPIPFIAF